MTRIHGTCARYVIRDRSLYVFCGGTSNRTEMRENLRLRRTGFGAWRVNAADLREAERVHAGLPNGLQYNRIVVHGFSRGAAIAALTALFRGVGVSRLYLYAPKRSVSLRAARWMRRYLAYEAQAYRFDIIPMLPPWYAGWRCRWSRWMWPWRAHEQSARDFARARHEAGRG